MRTLALAFLLTATLVAGCGADDEQPASGSDGTQLRIVVTGAGGGPQTIELDCGSGAPCERRDLDRLAEIFAPDDPARACTEIYGGPEKAHVSGRLEGRMIDLTINRSDGCGISDYQVLFDVLDREPPLAH